MVNAVYNVFKRAKEASKNMSDKELEHIKIGDEAAFSEILKKFEPLINSEVSASLKSAVNLEADADEMRSEAMLALYRAVISYVPSENVTLGLYAKICIRNSLVSYVRKLVAAQKRKKREAERQAKETRNETEEYLFALESSEKLKNIINNELTDYERLAFEGYIRKESYAEIGAKLGRSEKSVGNAIYRVKRKIKKLYMPD